jgi:hypothetical protein
LPDGGPIIPLSQGFYPATAIFPTHRVNQFGLRNVISSRSILGLSGFQKESKEQEMSASSQAVRRFASVTALAVTVLAMAAVASATSPARAEPAVSELVRFSQGQFPEGLSVAPDGTILAGVINTGDIIRITANGTQARFAHVPVPQGGFLTGVFALDSTNVYALVFSQDDKNGVWIVSQHGMNVAQLAKLPAGAGPNDLIRDAKGQLYVTDMVGGRVFRVQPDGSVAAWARDPLLLGNVGSPGPFGIPIGANGIVLSRSNDALYVGVTEKSRIVRIPIRADGSAGPMSVLAENPALNGADGIDLGPDGRIYAAVNAQNQIAAVNPSTGSVQVVASGPAFSFPSSVRFTGDFRHLYVLNFDGPHLLGLAPGPARTGVLSVDVDSLLAPQPSAPVAIPVISPPNTGSAGLADRAYREGLFGLGVRAEETLPD